jgi:hypothetical protein
LEKLLEEAAMPPAEAYAPYDPLDTLKPVAEDVWIVDGPEVRMDYLGFHLPFPTRMTIVRLPGGGLWVHSPSSLTTALRAEIAALGRVRHLVAPNTLHYVWLAEWHAAFPEAMVWIPPDLAGRAKAPLPPATVLGDSPPAEWSGGIEQVVVHGTVLTEVDFFHSASRTLILTDLIENFERRRVRNRLLRWLIGMSGAADPDGKAPVDMRLSFLGRRQAVGAAVRQMLAWEPERVIIAHGRWYERNGTAELHRAFRWVL